MQRGKATKCRAKKTSKEVEMKYLIVIPDGTGDEPMEELENKTALEVADIPLINELATKGEIGMVQNIPEGIPPGSDAANLSVMGYDPSVYLTGRSPLEAASIGINMSETDVSFRVNISTLYGEGEYENLTIKDHSAGDITTEEADELLKAIKAELETDDIKFYTGVSYRHCMIVKNGETTYDLTPPHDALEQKTGPHMPKGEGVEFISEMMKKSYEILKDHPINKKRIAEGKNPGNTLWIWGLGKKPRLSSFQEKYGITGAAISAVDLIKGIAICAGLEAPEVEGATGTVDTDYTAKANAGIQGYKDGLDFIYMHIEGTDECSHQGDLEGKLRGLNCIDQKILKPMLEYLESTDEEFSILIVPDHRTSLKKRTHTSDPVPFVVYRAKGKTPLLVGNPKNRFSEVSGETGMTFDAGYKLTDYFFGK